MDRDPEISQSFFIGPTDASAGKDLSDDGEGVDLVFETPRACSGDLVPGTGDPSSDEGNSFGGHLALFKDLQIDLVVGGAQAHLDSRLNFGLKDDQPVRFALMKKLCGSKGTGVNATAGNEDRIDVV